MGPVYIHADSCVQANGDLSDTEVLSLPLLVKGFDSNGSIVKTQQLPEESKHNALDGFMRNKDIVFSHARDAEYGCFIARIQYVKLSD